MPRPCRPLAPLLAGILLGAASLPVGATTKYLAFGDSITAGSRDDPSRAETGYPPRLETLLVQGGIEDAKVVNHGLGGETTSEGVSRIDDALAFGGDYLLLMEGTNDIAAGISLETTLFNLQEMARKAKNKGIPTVHATVIPRRPDAALDSSNFLTEAMAVDVRKLAFEEGRELVDPFEAFIRTPSYFEELYYLGNDDRIGHPDAEGYDFLAEVFADVLLGVDSVAPVTGLLQPADGQLDVSPTVTVLVELFDFGAGIDLAATTLTIDGDPVEADQAGDESRAELRVSQPGGWAGVVEVGVQGQDLADPPNLIDRLVSRWTVEGTTFLSGDLNLDGRVDGADLVLFGLSFGAGVGGPRYVAAHDLNSDGVIDGADLALLAADFGESTF